MIPGREAVTGAATARGRNRTCNGIRLVVGALV